jgi:hypothetical protein
MASIFNGFFDNLVNGALSPKGDMADWTHAARLYTDDNFRLAPKNKFLYHATLNINENLINKIMPGWSNRHSNEVNMLVKAVTLPKFDISVETKNKYNRKKNIQTRIDYGPVTLTFHDDNMGLTTQLWAAYYQYYYRDGTYGSRDGAGKPNQTARPYDRFNAYKGEAANSDRFGLDNDQYEPFFTSIQISQMARHQYLTMTLVNPIIESWQHDTLDNSASAEPVQNTMTVAYETVFYADGAVEEGNAPKGFASEHYDATPSPIAAGSGTSLFGSSGVLAGGASVLGDIAGGKADLGTLLTAARTVNNAKKLTKEGIRNEAYQVAGSTIRTATGTNVSGLANTSFPKSGGTGTQTTAAVALTTQKISKPLTIDQVQDELDLNPSLKDAVARKALAIGAVTGNVAGFNLGGSNPLTAYDALGAREQNAIKDSVEQQIASGNAKLLGIANSVITNYKENGQGNTTTVAKQKNPIGNT